MPEVEYRAAWRRGDPRIERDAELLLHRERTLRPEANAAVQMANLCAAAYIGDEMVAIAGANIRLIDFLRGKLAMYRCLVARNARRQGIGTALTVFSRDLLETWSREHPVEEVWGMGAIVQARLLVETQNWAVYPRTKLGLVGYTSKGFQMRVYWFAHARISRYWPGRPEALTHDDNGDEF